MIPLLNFLETSSGSILDGTTASNVLLDENGQFVDAEQAVSNISKWWTELDLVNKILSRIPSMIIAVVLIVIGILLSKQVSKLVVKTMKLQNVDPSVYNFIKRIVSVFIKLCFFLSAASLFINVNSIIAALGGAGLAAGLGLQGSVSQFASGISILINRPFKTGDYVEINGTGGSVSDIRFMNTIITTIDNKRIIIPNSHITSNEIINYTAENKRRVDMIFSISYSDSISLAKRIVTEVALENNFILNEPAPEVFVNAHNQSSIDLIGKFWCESKDYWNVYYSMQENIKLAFDKNGISIPFNQLDVHIKNES